MTGLETGESYQWRIIAVNIIGSGRRSDSLTVYAAVAPEAPSAPTSSNVEKTSMTINWTEPAEHGGTPITKYHIQWNEGGSGTTFYDFKVVDAGVFTENVRGLTTGEYYKWKIEAENAVGVSFQSGILNTLAAILPEAPAETPTSSSADKTSVTIDWIAPADNGGTPITNYIVQYNQGAGVNDFVDLETVAGDVLTYTATDLTTGEIYQWKIIAVNAIGASPETATLEVMAAHIPSAPDAPTISASDETSIILNWLAPADNGGTPLLNYIVQWNNGGLGNDFIDLITVDATVLTYTLNDLTTGENYSFRIIAKNAVGSGPNSLPFASVSAAFPDAPLAPTSSFASEEIITIDWIAPYDGGSPIIKYHV